MMTEENMDSTKPDPDEKLKNQNDIRKTAIAHTAVVGSESTTRFQIFFFLGTPLVTIYVEVFRYILLPVAAVGAIFNAVLSWRLTILQKYEPHSLARAILETVCAVAATAAIIGLLVATSIFSVITPAVTAATLGSKALFQTISAIVFFAKSRYCEDPEPKKELINKAKDAGSVAIACALGTAAIISVMIFAKPALAILGIVSGVLGTLLAAVKCYTLVKQLQGDNAPQATEKAASNTSPGKTASMIKLMQNNSSDVKTQQPAKQREPVTEPLPQTSNQLGVIASPDLPAIAPSMGMGRST